MPAVAQHADDQCDDDSGYSSCSDSVRILCAGGIESADPYRKSGLRERLNPTLDIEGIVFTMYDARTNLSMQVVENVKDHLNQKVYKTMIPRNIRLAEAPSYGMPINLYDAKSAGAES